nr:MAG TPA: hypothetical protein [Caudoviricetes sp.]
MAGGVIFLCLFLQIGANCVSIGKKIRSYKLLQPLDF